MSRVLVVEDDPAISEPLSRALRREGYEVASTSDSQQALDAAFAGEVDLLLLDLGLPGQDGLEVCRALRAGGSTLPVLVITARTTDADLVVGLDAGADDYVKKPFRLSELLARIRALLRRTVAPAEESVAVGAITVDLVARRAFVTDAEVTLTPKEFDLLAALVRRPGRVQPREDLMRQVWRTEWFGATKTLDMHVSTLRRKLGPAAGQLVTVRGVGFRLDAEGPG
jgi:DNA-binding response OmpR family regulator